MGFFHTCPLFPNTHKVRDDEFEKRKRGKKAHCLPTWRIIMILPETLSLSLCGWFYLNRWVDLWEQTLPHDLSSLVASFILISKISHL